MLWESSDDMQKPPQIIFPGNSTKIWEATRCVQVERWTRSKGKLCYNLGRETKHVVFELLGEVFQGCLYCSSANLVESNRRPHMTCGTTPTKVRGRLARGSNADERRGALVKLYIVLLGHLVLYDIQGG